MKTIYFLFLSLFCFGFDVRMNVFFAHKSSERPITDLVKYERIENLVINNDYIHREMTRQLNKEGKKIDLNISLYCVVDGEYKRVKYSLETVTNIQKKVVEGKYKWSKDIIVYKTNIKKVVFFDTNAIKNSDNLIINTPQDATAHNRGNNPSGLSIDILFVTSITDSRSYCLSQKTCVIDINTSTKAIVAHEILHCYGAKDIYKDAEASSKYPNSVMNHSRIINGSIYIDPQNMERIKAKLLK